MKNKNIKSMVSIQLPLFFSLCLASVLTLVSLPLVFIFFAISFAVLVIFASKLNIKHQKTLVQLGGYLLLAISFFAIWQQLTIPSLNAIAAVLMYVAWAKLCEYKSQRDSEVIWLIAAVLFAIAVLQITNFQIAILVSAFLLLLLSAASLITITHKIIAIKLTKLVVLSLPFAFILFITLPRINLPMKELGIVMGLPIPVEQDKSLGDKGLGRELSFGDIGELKNSDTRVLIASMPSDFELNANQQLYWRGPVYWQYKNEKWHVRPSFNQRRLRQKNGWGSSKSINAMASHRQNNVEYNVVLNPHGEYWLYGLDLPMTLTGESYLSQDYQLLSIRTVDKSWRYKVVSSLDYKIGAKEPNSQLELGLAYPTSNPKIKELGKSWRMQATTDEQVISLAKHYFESSDFLYATSDYQYQGVDQLDNFLFNRKVGYSQHYASALALLLRAADIPTRLVGGYRGAEQVGLTNLYVVNEHHAHIWLEAWYEQDGHLQWQRIDPAIWLEDAFSSVQDVVEESEVEVAQQQQQIVKQPSTDVATDRLEKNTKIKQKGSNWLDSMSQWTLDFDAEKQQSLAKKLGIKTLLWWHLLLIAFGLLISCSLVYWLVLRWLARGQRKPAHILQYHKLCTKLAKKGMLREPYEGAADYFSRCSEQDPTNKSLYQQLLNTYLPLCYADLSQEQKAESLKVFVSLSRKI